MALRGQHSLVWTLAEHRMWELDVVTQCVTIELSMLRDAAQYEQYPHMLASIWASEWAYALQSTCDDPSWPRQQAGGYLGRGWEQATWRDTVYGSGDRMWAFNG